MFYHGSGQEYLISRLISIDTQTFCLKCLNDTDKNALNAPRSCFFPFQFLWRRDFPKDMQHTHIHLNEYKYCKRTGKVQTMNQRQRDCQDRERGQTELLGSNHNVVRQMGLFFFLLLESAWFCAENNGFHRASSALLSDGTVATVMDQVWFSPSSCRWCQRVARTNANTSTSMRRVSLWLFAGTKKRL